jgi:hypothetical protein
VAGSCECGNEPSGSLKIWGIFWFASPPPPPPTLASQGGLCSIEHGIRSKTSTVSWPLVFLFISISLWTTRTFVYPVLLFVRDDSIIRLSDEIFTCFLNEVFHTLKPSGFFIYHQVWH